MPEAEKTEFLQVRGKSGYLYLRNWLTCIEIDPPILQRTFKANDKVSAGPKEAMQLIVNKLKAAMIGERHFKPSCTVKETNNCRVYGLFESRSTDDEKKGDNAEANMSVDQTALSIDTIHG